MPSLKKYAVDSGASELSTVDLEALEIYGNTTQKPLFTVFLRFLDENCEGRGGNHSLKISYTFPLEILFPYGNPLKIS